MRDDLYQLLDVDPSATQEELKAAYRRQAKKFHPDRNGGDPAAEERFKDIVEAYRILGDPAERELYDADCERDRKYAGAPERMLNYLHVQDAVDALLVLAQSGESRRYTVCGESFSKAEAYALLERLTGVPAADADAAPSHRGCGGKAADSSAIRELGWSPRHTFAEFVIRHCHA